VSALEMWTIYAHPKDYPQGYVVRRCQALAGVVAHDLHAQTAGDLQAARLHVPPGKVCIGRQPDDDPVIVEVWL
jgi:hypothetical protein